MSIQRFQQYSSTLPQSLPLAAGTPAAGNVSDLRTLLASFTSAETAGREITGSGRTAPERAGRPRPATRVSSVVLRFSVSITGVRRRRTTLFKETILFFPRSEFLTETRKPPVTHVLPLFSEMEKNIFIDLGSQTTQLTG
ncbi:hypothetical protein EVAR_38854_1 [Eumeta japonica]|uniref:Uncharacterized protein n=1 Tax=Eumeta variegata TaxID=151549 RepID=A0A4C1X8N4_EUMVA|nr:hypothetical protein EVAR_38854_1 [Eumeta japonica]